MHRIAAGERLHFRFTETDALQLAERNALQAMAGRTDFLIHLEPTLDRRFIERAEHAVELPIHLLRLFLALGGEQGRAHQYQRHAHPTDNRFHERYS